MQEILIDITKVCRTCLKESSDLRSIFCEDLKQNEKLSSMISFCTETEVKYHYHKVQTFTPIYV